LKGVLISGCDNVWQTLHKVPIFGLETTFLLQNCHSMTPQPKYHIYLQHISVGGWYCVFTILVFFSNS